MMDLDDIANPACAAMLDAVKGLLVPYRDVPDVHVGQLAFGIAAGMASALGVVLRITDDGPISFDDRLNAVMGQIKTSYEDANPPPFNTGQFE